MQQKSSVGSYKLYFQTLVPCVLTRLRVSRFGASDCQNASWAQLWDPTVWRPSAWLSFENLPGEKERPEVLKEVSDYARPEPACPNVKQREQDTVNSNQNETGNTLIGVANAKSHRRNQSRNHPTLETPQQAKTGHQVTAKTDFLAEPGRERHHHPHHLASRLLRD